MNETQLQTKAAGRLDSIIARTNKTKPSPEDLQELKKLFDDEPNFALDIGNAHKIILENIVQTIYANSAMRREAGKRYIKKMKNDFRYDSSTIIEKLLIDEIIICWHVLNQTQAQHHGHLNADHSLKVGIYWEKRLDMAQKRHLRAIETLAKVRRMIAQTQRTGVKMYQDLLTAGKVKNCEKSVRK